MTIGDLFSFEGRVGRGRYVAVFFGTLVVGLFGMSALYFVAGNLVPTGYEYRSHQNFVLAVFLIPWAIVITWVFFANTVRRFHDFNWTGAAFLLVLLPVIGQIISLALIFVGGTAGPNSYGPPP